MIASARADGAPGPIVVLLPTRQRAAQALESVRSLQRLAAEVESFRVLLAVDADDDQAKAYTALGLDAGVRTSIAWFGERHGYRNLHEYYNQLAHYARDSFDASWLMLWNDDVQMLTLGWDRHIREHDPSRPSALNITAEQPGAMNLFPVVSRAWFDVVGHLSLQAHTDTWIQDTSRAAGCERNESRVRVLHEREGDGDPELYAVTSPEFYSPAFADLRAIDAAKLRDACHG